MKNSSKSILLLSAVLATVIMVLYAQFVLGSSSECFTKEETINSLGLSFSYTKKEVMAFVSLRSIEELKCYISFLKIWDVLFPLLYTTMYTLWIIYLFKNWKYLILFPILNMLADWSENYMEVVLISQYLKSGNLNETYIALGSVITSIKWIISVIIYAIIIYGLIILINRYFTHQKTN